ncbi:MAG: asparagine synthase (glutamine-hydrolyzing) [Chitinophagaceae bacterium]|nr:asparagine synthase (glutamine-hydrolyzing) [Chitinophagaceae bacterium]
MCGIAGIIQTNPGRFQLQQLQQMTDAIAHRGPDGAGEWCNQNNTVLLGHRRLSVIDLSSAGDQPMHYLDRYSIIHNGEIYNYKELKSELQQKGYSFRSQTDTEVIVAAWDYWKEDCLQHFDGMFAFAIWDEVEQELFAAVDRFGEKPFYYTLEEDCFLFGSEMKALWAAGIAKRPNLQMLFNFITIGYTSNPEKKEETFYQQIFRLPAASYLQYSLDDQMIDIETWWTIDPGKEEKNIPDEAAISRFNELFQTSVSRRLRSDVPLGSSLSGGLDSSSIAAVVHSLTKSNPGFKVFTASFPGFDKDETAFARQVADRYGLQQELVNITATDLLKDWEKLCLHQEEPFGSSSSYAQYKVYELAKENGIKVLLDGQGADEILAGYHKYFKWYWQELFRNRKLSRSGERKATLELGINEPFTWKNKIAAWFPSFASIVIENHYLAKALAHPDLTKAFVQQQSRDAYYTPPDHFTLNGVLHFNSFVHGLQELLRLADRNSMAHGREVRLPFLSHELVEFLFSLPSHFKIRKGRTKWLLRESMKNTLPETITWRTDKVGFEPPQQQWMEDKNVVEAIRAAKEKLILEKILKPEVLDKNIRPQAAHDPGNDDWRYLSAALLFK